MPGGKTSSSSTRHPEERFPEDLLLARELIVERPSSHATSLGQLIHADGAEAAFQKQALGGIDDGLARSAASGLRGGLFHGAATFHLQTLRLH